MTTYGTCHASFTPVKEVFQKHIDEGKTLGAACCLIVDGETLVDLYGGHADAAKTQPWKDNTLVNVYSTTKAWTGLCVLKLIEQGHVKLDAPISDYWPEFAQGGKAAATVKHALTHQTGAQTLRQLVTPEELYNWDTMVKKIAAEPAFFEPGSQTNYHAWTYGHINGEIVRRADPKHRSLGTFWREEFAEPLGIPDIYIGLPESQHGRCAELVPGPGIPETTQFKEEEKKQGVHMGGKNVMVTTMLNPPRGCDVVNQKPWRLAEMGASGGVTDARSMAKLYHQLSNQLNGKATSTPVPIAREILQTACSEQAKLFGGPQGLGFQLRLMGKKGSDRVFGHPGLGGNQAFGDPDRDLGFGYVRNRAIGFVKGVERNYAKELADACYDCLEAYKGGAQKAKL